MVAAGSNDRAVVRAQRRQLHHQEHKAVACEASDSCDAPQNREGRKKIKPQDRSRLDANASTTAEAGPENHE